MLQIFDITTLYNRVIYITTLTYSLILTTLQIYNTVIDVRKLCHCNHASGLI